MSAPKEETICVKNTSADNTSADKKRKCVSFYEEITTKNGYTYKIMIKSSETANIRCVINYKQLKRRITVYIDISNKNISVSVEDHPIPQIMGFVEEFIKVNWLGEDGTIEDDTIEDDTDGATKGDTDHVKKITISQSDTNAADASDNNEYFMKLFDTKIFIELCNMVCDEADGANEADVANEADDANAADES